MSKFYILLIVLLEITTNTVLSIPSRKFVYPTNSPTTDCQIAQTGQVGICKSFSQCQSAQVGLYSFKIYPTVCYFEGHESFVCCHQKIPLGSLQYTHSFPTVTGHFQENQWSVQQSSQNVPNQFGGFPSTITEKPIQIFQENQWSVQQSSQNVPNQFGGLPSTITEKPIQIFQENQWPVQLSSQNVPNQFGGFPSSTTTEKPIQIFQENQWPVQQSSQNVPNQFGGFPSITTEKPIQIFQENQWPVQQSSQNVPNQFGGFPSITTEKPIQIFQENQQFIQQSSQNVPNDFGGFPSSTTEKPIQIFQENQQFIQQSSQNVPNQFGGFLSSTTEKPIQIFQENQQFIQQNVPNEFGGFSSNNSVTTLSSIPPSQNQGDDDLSSTTALNRISEEECSGLYDVNTLVGADPTTIGEYPFMAAIGWLRNFDGKLEFNCGGFLVSPKFVITAAHCANFGGDDPVAVRTGGIDLNNDTRSDLDIPIKQIYVHPGYIQNETYNDIAIIELTMNANDDFACLWQTNEIGPEFDAVTALGYGDLAFAGPRSNSLLQVKLKLFDNDFCVKYYQPAEQYPKGITKKQVCAGDPNNMKDTCQGDSGGPILIQIAGQTSKLKPYIVGITSFGQGCAGVAPSLYTRISSYLYWIESIVWPTDSTLYT